MTVIKTNAFCIIYDIQDNYCCFYFSLRQIIHIENTGKVKRLKLFCFGFGQAAQSFVDHLLDSKVDLKLTITSRKNTSELTFKNLKLLNCPF